MRNLILVSSLAAFLGACSGGDADTAQVAGLPDIQPIENRSERIELQGEQAELLALWLDEAGIVPSGSAGASIETSFVAWFVAEIDCRSVISSGSYRCTLDAGRDDTQAIILEGHDAQAVHSILRKAGLPKRFQLEGARYTAKDVTCFERHSGAAVYNCSLTPKADN